MGTFAEAARGNATLYNCCKDNEEPDWSIFDGIEINACASDDGATSTVPLHEAEFFTVYGHRKEGGCDALTDVSTRKLAHTIGRLFLAKLGEGATFFDCCWKGEERITGTGCDYARVVAPEEKPLKYLYFVRWWQDGYAQDSQEVIYDSPQPRAEIIACAAELAGGFNPDTIDDSWIVSVDGPFQITNVQPES